MEIVKEEPSHTSAAAFSSSTNIQSGWEVLYFSLAFNASIQVEYDFDILVLCFSVMATTMSTDHKVIEKNWRDKH